MTNASSSTLTLIGFAPTKADIDLAVAALTQATHAQTLPTKALLYAIDKVATPPTIKSRALAGLESHALVQLHNSGLIGDPERRPAYFRSGFMAVALRHALKDSSPGSLAAWPATPAAFLGGRLEPPISDEPLWRASVKGAGWRLWRLDDPAPVTTVLTHTVDSYLHGTAWRLADPDLDYVLAAAMAVSLEALA